MPADLHYTGAALNRAGDQRRDDASISAHLEHPGLRVVPVWRDRNLIIIADAAADQAPEAVLLQGSCARETLGRAKDVAFLGLDGERPHFAADLSDHDESDLALLAGGGVFEDLREMRGLLTPEETTVLAYARGLLYWHRRHRFCGVCGAETVSRQAGHQRTCTNRTCGTTHFPRTDPAVIMLVTYVFDDGVERALMGWSQRWDFPMYSTLAGFVEPGESLEEAVSREVFEEAGVEATDVVYRASQPWPFPSSLMVGFRARALSAGLTVDPEEMRDVRWFSRADVRGFKERGLRLPRRDSIARFLIREWLEEDQGQ